MRSTPSLIAPGHDDFETLNRLRAEIFLLSNGEAELKRAFPSMLQDAIDFVLDPVRTGRTEVKLLDNVEKTFVGLKIEHLLRDFLDVPKGIRDLVIGEVDVDVKNTLSGTWMIPRESYSVAGACLLVSSDDDLRQCSLGIFLARPEYLNALNQDKKRSVSKFGRGNILWLVEEADFPASHWADIDMPRFRELRKIRGGNKRAAQFFRENLRKRIHRRVILSLLHDQEDPMKRIRANGGAPDTLRREKIAILTGAYDKDVLVSLGMLEVDSDQAVGILPQNPTEEEILRTYGVID